MKTPRHRSFGCPDVLDWKDLGSPLRRDSKTSGSSSKVRVQSETKNQGSRIEDQGSRIKDQGSRIKDRESRIKDQGSRIEDRGREKRRKSETVIKHRCCCCCFLFWPSKGSRDRDLQRSGLRSSLGASAGWRGSHVRRWRIKAQQKRSNHKKRPCRDIIRRLFTTVLHNLSWEHESGWKSESIGENDPQRKRRRRRRRRRRRDLRK